LDYENIAFQSQICQQTRHYEIIAPHVQTHSPRKNGLKPKPKPKSWQSPEQLMPTDKGDQDEENQQITNSKSTCPKVPIEETTLSSKAKEEDHNRSYSPSGMEMLRMLHQEE
jgi:hypothetical protein